MEALPPKGISGLLLVVLLIALVGSIGAASFILKAGGESGTAPGLQAPTLISPPNGATDVSLTPTFNWSPVSDALSYYLQLSTSSDFSSPLLFQVAGPPYTLPSQYSLSTNTTYYWRVRAAKGSVEFSSWSSVWHFTTTPKIFVSPGQLMLENIENGRTVIVIRHMGGWKKAENVVYRADNVVENSPVDGKFHWKNLELRLNYVIVPAENIVTFISEGRNAIGRGYGYYSMVEGDIIRIQLGTPLKTGNEVSLKWKNQTLVEMTVTY